MDYRILGPLEVSENGRLLKIRAAKQRALLAILLLRANEVVSSDDLIDALWNETPPRTAEHVVRVYVSQLRKVLEADAAERVLLTEPTGYALRTAPTELDSSRFEALVREGTERLAEGGAKAAANRLADALGLWRGPALADFRYEPFAQREIGRLEELRVVCLERRVEADLRLGRSGELVGELETLVAEHPLRETFRRSLMLALYRAGRQSDALATYRETRRVLVDELGIEPSAALRDLEARILRQDPTLDAGVPFALEPIVETRPARAVTSPSRRIVTVLCCELVDSTGRIDTEALPRVLARYIDVVAAVVPAHGGRLETFVGDTVFAIFGTPRVHEDDAFRAVRAAHELRDALAEANVDVEREWGLRLDIQIAVSTGEVVDTDASADQPLVIGRPFTSAAELARSAGPGGVLLDDATRRLVAAASRPLDAPLVGRTDELARLGRTFARATEDRLLAFGTVVGPAGIGKTRLVRELAAAVADEAQVLAGRCLPYGEGITYWPLREVVLEAFGPDPREPMLRLLAADERGASVVEQILAATGLAKSGVAGDDLGWAFRRLFEALGRRRPILLVLDDVHWAEPAFLDLLESIAGRRLGAPILVVALARPELADERPSFERYTLLTLAALDDDDSRALLAGLQGDVDLDETRRANVVATAQGNPLFLEQLFAAIAEGAVPGAATALPLTIQALLATRLQRLGPGERTVLEAAAVVGKGFTDSALLELLPPDARESLARHLRSLVRKQLVRPDRSASGADAFAFQHLLIQETTYRGIPKERRASMHEQFGDWLSESAGGDFEEIVGYHLEQAHRYRAELGPVTERERRLGERASEHLARAGRRAYAHGDVRAAINLLGRARSIESHVVGAIELGLAEAYASVGKFDAARGLLVGAIEASAERGDRRTEWLARILLALVSDTAPGESTPQSPKETADKALTVFGELGDELGLARAWLLSGRDAWNHCRFDDAAQSHEKAVAHARRAGDETAEMQALTALVGAINYGSADARDAQRRIEALVAREAPLPAFEARAVLALARQRSLQGEFVEGRALYLQAKELLEELGRTYGVATAAAYCDEVALLAGDADFAEQELRAAYELLGAMGAVRIRSMIATLLGDALYALGRRAEAEELADVALETAGDGDVASQARSRALKAKTLAARGEHQAADELGSEAVDLLAGTDDLFGYAQTLMALAEVRRLAGRMEDMIPVVTTALEVSDRKGDVVTVQRARAQLAELQVALAS